MPPYIQCSNTTCDRRADAIGKLCAECQRRADEQAAAAWKWSGFPKWWDNKRKHYKGVEAKK